MALFSGSLFAGELYAGKLFGADEAEEVIRGAGHRRYDLFVGAQEARAIRKIKKELALHRQQEIDEIRGIVSDGAIKIEAIAPHEIEQITEAVVQEWDFAPAVEEYGVHEEELEQKLREFIEAYIQQLLDEEAIVLMMFLM